LTRICFPQRKHWQSQTGTFDLDVTAGVMGWSEGMFAIHGFAPGQVVPTVDLLLFHKHPDDRESIRKIIQDLSQTGGQTAALHRVIDSRGREHQVLSSYHAVHGPSGTVARVRCFMVDLTWHMREESRQAVDDALQGAFAHRAVIEQAKGIIMAARGVDAEAAFELLTAQSQHTNTKLHAVAVALAEAAARGETAEALAQWHGRANT
jgi:DNA-binding FrmR family transcriptional regulator